MKRDLGSLNNPSFNKSEKKDNKLKNSRSSNVIYNPNTVSRSDDEKSATNSLKSYDNVPDYKLMNQGEILKNVNANKRANKKSKLTVRNQRKPIDNLSVNISGFNNQNFKRSKKDVYIANSSTENIFKRPDNLKSDDLIFSDNTESDELMKEFDINNIKEKSKLLQKQVDDLKKQKERKLKRAPKEGSLTSKLFNKTNFKIIDDIDDNLINIDTVEIHSRNDSNNFSSILGDSNTIEKVKEKYFKFRPDFNPIIIKNNIELKNIVNNYRDLIENILNGKVASYFYDIAKKYNSSSQRSMITDMELINIPKNKYFGYVGSIRGFKISKFILEDETLGESLKNKRKFNKVVQFWGLSEFSLYVLTPEIIARIILKDKNKFDKKFDLEDAYDEMEDTNDYGLYIMDKIKLDDEISLISEEDEIGATKKENNPINLISDAVEEKKTDKKSASFFKEAYKNEENEEEEDDEDEDDEDNEDELMKIFQ